MIYRIIFEPQGGYWCIQFMIFYLFWRTVTREISGPDTPVYEVVKFDTYDKAEAWVATMGIDKAYDRRPTRGFLSAIHAAPQEAVSHE